MLAGDVDPTPHRPSPHLCWLCGGGSQKLFSAGGVDSDQQAALSTGGDRDSAGDEERQPAEHRLLAHGRVVGEYVPHAGRELPVVGHYELDGACQSRIAAVNCSGASEGTKWAAPLTMTVW